MSMRPKTIQRLSILFVMVVIIGAAGTGIWRYRISVANAIIQQDRVDGMKAYQAGDFKDAINPLSTYVTHHKDDADALLAFGISRANVPEADNGHISQAISILRLYCEHRPADIDTKHRLLEMEEPASSYAGPALELADDLLSDNPNDLVALKARARVNFRNRRFADSLKACDKYVDLNPTDLEMQFLDLYVMQTLTTPATQMQAKANKQQAAHPDDPRFLLVQAWAYIFSQYPGISTDQAQNNNQTALKLLQDAANKYDPPDVQYVKYLVDYLDRAAQHTLSQAVLEKSVAKFNDPDLLRLLVQRWWENGKYKEVVDRLDKLDAHDPKTDDSMIAYKALSLSEMNRKSDAQALVPVLTARQDTDAVAAGWSIALTTDFDTKVTPKQQATQYETALTHDPNNAVVEYMLGLVYVKMGESELAQQEFEAAEKGLPSWIAPSIQIQHILLAKGVTATPEAGRQINQSFRDVTTSQEQYAAIVSGILIRFSQLQSNPDSTEARSLLEVVQNLQTRNPGEPVTLPIYAALLNETGQRQAAVDVISKATTQPASTQELLLKLADFSRVEKLGMEPQVYDSIEKQYGLTPELAFARAYGMLQDAHTADGLQFLQDAKAKGVGKPQNWDLAICRYREAAHDPGAADAWIALGDTHPDDLLIQQTILDDETSAWSKHDFIDRSIKRLQNLTGDEGLSWKIARARWLLSGSDPSHGAHDAINLLSDVTKKSQGEFQPHVLMAMAYESLGDNPTASGEWRQAADLAPNNPEVLYNYMKSLHDMGKTDDAQVYCDKLMSLHRLPTDIALQAAALMASQGDTSRAEALLTNYRSPDHQELHDALLAKVYRMEGSINNAATVYLTLAANPNLSLSTVREAADFFGSQHDDTNARKFLDRLDNFNLPAGHKELILADYEERFGDKQVAEQHYAAAVKAAPDDPDAAAQQVGFFLRQNRMSDVNTALSAALAHFHDNAELNNLKSVQQDMTVAKSNSDVSLLMQAISHDPQSAAANDTLAAMVAASKSDPQTTLANLRALLTKYPDFLPLYWLTARQLIDMNRLAEGVDLAGKAMVRFPESPDAAHLAADAYSKAGRWNDVIDAAKQWRQRGAEHPAEADLAIAIADLNTNQQLDAQNRLQPYVISAETDPDSNEDLLRTYCSALIRSGDEAGALNILKPLAQKETRWRYDWLAIAVPSHTDGAAAVAFIDQVKPLLDAGSLQDQQLLADTYFNCATHLGYGNGFTLAQQTLKPFLNAPGVTETALMDYASASGATSDNADAETIYRRVIQMDPNQAVAKNNLANIIETKGDPASLKEAETLAHQAIDLAPSQSSSSSFYDTLARIQLKQGRNEDALSTFQQGYRVQPHDLDILVGLAFICSQTNRIEESSRYLTEIGSTLLPDQKLSPDLQTELDSARAAVRKATARTPATSP